MDETRRPPALDVPDELVGARVLLRPWRPADAPALFEAVDESRARIGRWLARVWHHATVAESEAFCRAMADDWAARAEFAVGIWHRDSGRLLGASGLHNVEWDTPSAEIGYWLRDGAVGHGYAEEAVRLLLAFAFECLGLARVGLNCDPSNVRSRRIPGVLGFALDGRLRSNRRTPDGALRDTLVHSILADEWRAKGSSGSGPARPG